MEEISFFLIRTVDEIESLIAKNPLTPVKVRDHVNTLKSQRAEFLVNLNNVSNGLAALGIKTSTLIPGETEIGFSIPRPLFDNELGGLVSELNTIKLMLNFFIEAVPDAKEKTITVRQISSSDPTLFFGMDPKVLIVIGATITWLLNTWKQSLDIRKIYQDARDKGISEDVLKSLKDEIQKKIDESIEEKVKELVPLEKRPARSHELAVGLSWAMRSLLARIERGLSVEIRVLPPPVQKDTADKAVLDEDQTNQKTFSEAGKIGAQLVFPKDRLSTALTALPPPEPENPENKAAPGKPQNKN